jgi:hypothetical protein
MAFEAASELPERHELVVGDRTGRAKERVVQRGGVALAEDQVIVRGVLRLRPVVAEMAGEENGHQIGGRQRRRRMAGAREQRIESARSWRARAAFRSRFRPVMGYPPR